MKDENGRFLNRPYGNSEQERDRRSLRLKGYDYSQVGAYFITVCTQDRECLFGNVVSSEMQLNDAGRMIQGKWETLAERFPEVELDALVVMPNHVHAIIAIAIDAIVGAGLVPARRATTRVAPTVGDIVGAFKSLTTVSYTHGVKQLGWPAFRGKLWQRNYYEHVVRNEESLRQIRQYIADNPAQWDFDRENPAALVPQKRNDGRGDS
jgi:putative transposase